MQLDSTDIIVRITGQDTASHLGSQISCIGDINGDGFDDIGMFARIPRGFNIYYGGNPPDTSPDLILPGNAGRVTAIDLTGDGIDDIIIANVQNPTTNPFGTIYFFQGYGDSIGTVPFDSLSPPTQNYGFGTDFKAGYVDNDNLGDLLVWKPQSPGGIEVCYYSGAPSIDTVPDWNFKKDGFYTHQLSGMGFIDFDGDDIQDVFLGLYAGLDTVSYVYIFLGPDFKSTPDIILGRPLDSQFDTLDHTYFAHKVFNVGDYDADGWEEMVVLYQSLPLIYSCGPGADTLYDMVLDGRSRIVAPAGDINGDGYIDLISGHNDLTPFGKIVLFLGGPKADPRFDEEITEAELPPLFLKAIGYEVSTAGDFNGDGIDDFMFSCEDFYNKEPGHVFVYSGDTSITTDVEEFPEKTLPKEFDLGRNYPNPFNGTTIIEFELSQRSVVTLEIYNSLGYRVRTLLNELSLPPGKHRAVWNSLDENMTVAPSGVYICKMSTQFGTEYSKMSLIK